MSSRRFPGKMLAPFRGEPLIRSVVRAVATALPDIPIVVATSVDPSDDPLVTYVASLGLPVFRGALDHVFDRFLACADAFPCRFILRVNGDSPLLGPRMLRAVAAESPEVDLVTTIFPRTFPRGQNAELLRVETMRAIDRSTLTAEDQEHVTPFFYRNATRFRIRNIESADPRLAECSVAVDTVDDLRRLAQDDAGVAADPEPRATAAVGA
jgi:spore coat polysaccharide biosynthesis protein SpsF